MISRMKTRANTKKSTFTKAVQQSSKIEGLSLHRAKRNTSVIKKLKQYGRAFSV